MSRRLPIQPVAIVVFVNADGRDPITTAEQAVHDALLAATGPDGRIAVDTRVGVLHVQVGRISELNRANGSLIGLKTSPAAYPH